MLVRHGEAAYVVELKAVAEGRSDRLIPLWSQAHLQALRAGGDNYPSLAVVAAPRIASRVAEHILKFAQEYAPNGAAGVIDFEGLRLFRGPYLEGFDQVKPAPPFLASVQRRDQVNLFSDLNQWMLKVLLAPELPAKILSAPRGNYRNASQLAKAASVSVMSAFRFVQALQQEGYLHESDPHINLVRREDLLGRWQAASAQSIKEIPVRFLLRRDPRVELRKMLSSGRVCLGLFAAADAHGHGFVHGVPPHVYVRRLRQENLAAWRNLVPADGEAPDIVLREAPAQQSIFRGLVQIDDLPVCDLLQVWLDVSAHPSRGQEQSEMIGRQILHLIFGTPNRRG